MKNVNNMKNTYIDLFCGAGGLSYGFEAAGFNNIFSVEIDKYSSLTYKRNFPNHNLITKNISDITENDIKNIIKGRHIDIIVGGPPCQGFSKAGNIGRRFLEDERNLLFLEFYRFVKIIKPKMFLMENVSALKTHNNGETLNEILVLFEKLGYSIKYDVLNSVNYEVPQERRRIFIIGELGDNKFNFPKKSNRLVTVSEVINDLPSLESGQNSTIFNHNAMKHSTQMLEKMSYVKDGGNRSDIPDTLRPKSGDSRKYIRFSSNKPSVCITGDMRKIFHYSQNRALTARELARIQTFPDSFYFEGTSISIQQQIGNAVPPLLAYKIANQIKEVLNNE